MRDDERGVCTECGSPPECYHGEDCAKYQYALIPDFKILRLDSKGQLQEWPGNLQIGDKVRVEFSGRVIDCRVTDVQEVAGEMKVTLSSWGRKAS